MKRWIKSGLVPKQNSSLEPADMVFRGKLKTVWLGGLYNPSALLTALKHEKAILANTTYDQVQQPSLVFPVYNNQLVFPVCML